MKHGLVEDGEIVITDDGDAALMHLLPAGRFSHVWSQRLAGSLQSPQFDPTRPVTFSIEVRGRKICVAVVHCRSCDQSRTTHVSESSLSGMANTDGR